METNENQTTVENQLQQQVRFHEGSKRRMGRFRVTEKVLTSIPEELAQALAGVLIVHAEMRYEDLTVRYTAYAPDFPLVEPHFVSPCFELELTRIPGDKEKGIADRVVRSWVEVPPDQWWG